jgi:hypothetical protein
MAKVRISVLYRLENRTFLKILHTIVKPQSVDKIIDIVVFPFIRLYPQRKNEPVNEAYDENQRGSGEKLI